MISGVSLHHAHSISGGLDNHMHPTPPIQRSLLLAQAHRHSSCRELWKQLRQGWEEEKNKISPVLQYFACCTCVRADQHHWSLAGASTVGAFCVQTGEGLWWSLIKGSFLFMLLSVAHPPSPNPLFPLPSPLLPGAPRRDPRLMCFSLLHNGLWNGRLHALCQQACGRTLTNPLCPAWEW